MTFTGQVDPTLTVGSTPRRNPERGWVAAFPLWITEESGRHRRVATDEFVLDLFGFSPASDVELGAVGLRYARNGDLLALDAIATGSGVLVIRQPQLVTVVTDLAGVWPVFYATVARSLIFSSNAESLATLVGGEVNDQWLAARLLAGSVPETWSEGSPYRHVRAVPAGGALQRLADALSTAVRGRTQAYCDMSVDLSGGLDSSTVATLAAASQPEGHCRQSPWCPRSCRATIRRTPAGWPPRFRAWNTTNCRCLAMRIRTPR